MAIFKTPKQVRPKEMGKTTFATGRADLSAAIPNPKSCGSMRHRMHERREHRERY